MKKPFCHRMARLCLLLLLLTTQHEVYCRGLVLQHSALSKAPHSSTFRFSALPSEAKLYFPLTAPILVKGKVTNETGEGIPGVSILLKGTNTGTATDGEGNYSLTLPDGSGTLIFSFIGYLSEEVLVSNRSTINISLLPDVKSLTEVVVVGYGTQEKREITGSVSTLDARQLEDQPVGQFSQRLQGRIAGVQVNQGTGKPGEGMSFRIRGAASVNAGNGPLFVVDGFPLVGDISQINPNEIESFTVLKDASASSLYGSRAANGVVLITTKIARTGQTQVQFSANYGTQIVPQQGRPDLMNGREWAQYQKELYEDKAKYEGYTGGVPQEYQNPEQYGEGTDWYGILLRNAPISSYNLSLASNKDRFSTATTMGYFKQDGVVLNTDFIRYSIRSNNEYRVNDNIRVGVNLAPTYQSSQNFETDGSITGGIFYQAVVTAPIISPYNEDGSLKINLSTPGTLTAPNWLRVLKERKNRSQVFRLLSNAYAEIDFLKSFRFKSSINVELENGKLSAFIPSTASGNIFSPPPGQASAQYSTNNSVSWMAENTLTYTKTFNNHNFEALAGYSAQQYTREFNQLTGTNFPDNAVQWIDAAAIRNGSSNNTSWSLLSLVSRLNYNYQGNICFRWPFAGMAHRASVPITAGGISPRYRPGGSYRMNRLPKPFRC
jgi:TonB-linked SusC/RagA family outer membrane protein